MKQTCAECPNLQRVGSEGFWVVGCSATGLVVPHTANYLSGEVVLHRVPLECPRPDDEVVKREQRPISLHAELVHAASIRLVKY